MDPISDGHNPHDKKYPKATWSLSWVSHEGSGSQVFMSSPRLKTLVKTVISEIRSDVIARLQALWPSAQVIVPV